MPDGYRHTEGWWLDRYASGALDPSDDDYWSVPFPPGRPDKDEIAAHRAWMAQKHPDVHLCANEDCALSVTVPGLCAKCANEQMKR